MHSVSVVILTMGDRPESLAAAVASARSQEGVLVEVVLVVNGGNSAHDLADVVVEPGENTGIPGGRNLGAAAASGEFLCFLDDDAWYATNGVIAQAVEMAASNPLVAVVGLGITDADGETTNRHHPMLFKRPDHTCQATSFPGGACVIRKNAFDQVSGFYAEYFYGLEETDLAWRLIDARWQVLYAPLLLIQHPVSSPEGNHPNFFKQTARNRVWLARRLLPPPFALIYLFNWSFLSLVREWRRLSTLKAILRGSLTGCRHRPSQRQLISYRTVARLTKLKRPPII